MWNLYQEYEQEMELKTPFNAQQMLNKSGQNSIDSVLVVGACVESETRKDKFAAEFRIIRPPIPTGAPLPIQIQASIEAIVIPLSSGWQVEDKPVS